MADLEIDGLVTWIHDRINRIRDNDELGWIANESRSETIRCLTVAKEQIMGACCFAARDRAVKGNPDARGDWDEIPI